MLKAALRSPGPCTAGLALSLAGSRTFLAIAGAIPQKLHDSGN